MPRHSRKAKLRRKRRARLRRARTPLDEMHRLLGEFLRECGRVEFLMVIFADYISDASILMKNDNLSALSRKVRHGTRICVEGQIKTRIWSNDDQDFYKTDGAAPQGAAPFHDRCRRPRG